MSYVKNHKKCTKLLSYRPTLLKKPDTTRLIDWVTEWLSYLVSKWVVAKEKGDKRKALVPERESKHLFNQIRLMGCFFAFIFDGGGGAGVEFFPPVLFLKTIYRWSFGKKFEIYTFFRTWTNPPPPSEISVKSSKITLYSYQKKRLTDEATIHCQSCIWQMS